MNRLELENKLAMAKAIELNIGCLGIDCSANRIFGGFGCPLRGDDGSCTGGLTKVRMAREFIRSNEKSEQSECQPQGEIVASSEDCRSNLEEILAVRKENYGSFEDHSLISQRLKNVIASSRDRNRPFEADVAEALEMICHKIARIVNGRNDYADSWYDIAGYATLIANRINKENDK